MPSSKRKRRLERPTIHPRNRYSENPPDFRILSSLYPSFEPYVFYSRDGRPRIDWTDFNATRELTKVLLHHDHGVSWWIPDGQLCPTVPNRSNYIHWIEDLLSSNAIATVKSSEDKVRGFDIGTGANCIYPLLGASLLGWSFVGSDVTDVALEWAERNVKSNPHLSELIEIRKVGNAGESRSWLASTETKPSSGEITREEAESSAPKLLDLALDVKSDYYGPPVLVNVVKDGENFDFCMCNPPFFESMEEAGLNPKTSCGGTPEEMVCFGGEKAFISRIIEDSIALKQCFRWYTSMVGRKSNLKVLVSKLWEVGVSLVKTTEFVQGQTCRWGLAWSFVPPTKKTITSHVPEKSNLSFMLEGLQRQFSAIHVLKSVESYFLASGGASCKSNLSLFAVDVAASSEYCDAIRTVGYGNGNGNGNSNETPSYQLMHKRSNGSDPLDELCFRISVSCFFFSLGFAISCLCICVNFLFLQVFQQIPGTLLVRGSLQHRQSPLSGAFSLIFHQLEEVLKDEFCRVKPPLDRSNNN